MEWEGGKDQLGSKTKVNLSNWENLFKSLKNHKKNVIVECENTKLDSFVIGEIKKITDSKVFIQYFNGEGILAKKSTKVNFKDITIVNFEDSYIDVFSKYTRKNKA